MNTTIKLAPKTKSLEYRIKHWVNERMLRIAGKRIRAYSVLKHIGRRTGREYTMPVAMYPLGDGFVMAMLNNGSKCDWCQNVLAAGRCKVITQGVEHILERPEIIDQKQAIGAFPLLWRWLISARSLNEFLWVHHPQLAHPRSPLEAPIRPV